MSCSIKYTIYTTAQVVALQAPPLPCHVPGPGPYKTCAVPSLYRRPFDTLLLDPYVQNFLLDFVRLGKSIIFVGPDVLPPEFYEDVAAAGPGIDTNGTSNNNTAGSFTFGNADSLSSRAAVLAMLRRRVAEMAWYGGVRELPGGRASNSGNGPGAVGSSRRRLQQFRPTFNASNIPVRTQAVTASRIVN